jgi:hypothetical protein
MRCAVLALLVACSSGVPAKHAQLGEVGTRRPLGVNDVSILLAELQNPMLHDTVDTQCVGCHLATYLTVRRAAVSGLAASTLPGWYASPRAHAVHTIAEEDPRVVRAFGWAGNAPSISRRVANDTAQVLSEIEARFPPRRVP